MYWDGDIMKNIVCPKCGNGNETTRYFCASCGAFLDVDNYERVDYEIPEMKMMRIVDNLRHMTPSEQVPDEAFAVQAEKVERLRALYALPDLSNNAKLEDDMHDFLSLCRHPEFQIAFVGTIKTGKSTLINALLGKNYASMAVTPETAALTKFRYSPSDYVNVTFYTDEEWKKLCKSTHNADEFLKEYEMLNAESQKKEWIDHEQFHKDLASDEVEGELARWSSSKSPEHFFVKEIEVGISSLPEGFPPQVVFVDTPGLFDPVAYRSELTKQYIRRANAVFVCVDAQKVQQQEIETISTVCSISSNNREKVHIIATQWDRLNNPEKDWAEQKDWLVRQLTGKAFFATSDLARDNIMYTAAYIHILCRDYASLDKLEMKPLKKFAVDFDFDEDSVDDRLKMVDKANVHAVDKIIKEKLADNYRKFLLEDVEKKYLGIRHDLRRIADDKKDDVQELLNASKSELEEFMAKADEKRKNYEEIQTVSKQLDGIINQVEKETDKQMFKIINMLKLKINPGYKAISSQNKRESLRSIANKIMGRRR